MRGDQGSDDVGARGWWSKLSQTVQILLLVLLIVLLLCICTAVAVAGYALLRPASGQPEQAPPPVVTALVVTTTEELPATEAAPTATEAPPPTATPVPADTDTPVPTATRRPMPSATPTLDASARLEFQNVSLAADEPEHVVLHLPAFVSRLEAREATIYVWPVDGFRAASDTAGQRIDALAALLAEGDPVPVSGEQLPFLPFWPAAQLLHTKVAVLEFQNGSGIRYLTQYAQAYFPANNSDIFYTFQGLTDNGFYVAAIFPVYSASLPDEAGQTDAAFADNFPQYREQIEKDLEAQPDGNFEPSLAALDAVIAGIEVR
ncbi:MAG: hypothetical protein ACYC5O_03215 [Anaerolineae bacterium]